MNVKVDKIIEEIDKRTLLGAAYDCMSEKGKERFKQSLQKIIEGDNSTLKHDCQQ